MTDVAQFEPLSKTAVTDFKTAVAKAEPGVKGTVESTAEKLLADGAVILGTDLGC
jgi:hypothetical protein